MQFLSIPRDMARAREDSVIVSLIRALSLDQIWTLLAGAVILWFGFAVPVSVLDFWWHVKAGEVMLQTGVISRVDLFSFTAAGQPFILQNWLAELGYALSYHLGGLPLVLTLNALALAAAFWLVLYLAYDVTGDMRLAAGATVAAEIVARNMANARPQVFSALLFAIFYVIIDRSLRHKSRWLWLLPPLMALWANVHGAFVLGLGLLGVVTAVELVRRLLGEQRLSYREIARLSGVGVLCGLATLLNPEGLGIVSYIRTVMADPTSQKLVKEWWSPDARDPQMWPFFALLLGVLLLAAAGRRRPDWTRLAVFMVFGWLALTSVRNILWFALVAPPILADQITRLRLPSQEDAERERARGLSRRHPINIVLAAAILGITVLLSPWIHAERRDGQGMAALIDSHTPVGAAEFIAQQGIEGRIFHPQEYGDYLVWRLYPQEKVFVDGRVHLYDPAVWTDYIRIMNGADWQALLDRYSIQYVLLDRTDEGEKYLLQDIQSSSAWKPLYQDSVAVMFEKSSRAAP